MGTSNKKYSDEEICMFLDVYYRCNLGYWISRDDFLNDPGKFLFKVGNALTPLRVRKDLSPLSLTDLQDQSKFDSEWGAMVKHLQYLEGKGKHPLLPLSPNIEGFDQIESIALTDAIVFIMEMARKNEVDEIVATFVNPSLIPRYNAEQNAFQKCQQFVSIMNTEGYNNVR